MKTDVELRALSERLASGNHRLAELGNVESAEWLGQLQEQPSGQLLPLLSEHLRFVQTLVFKLNGARPDELRLVDHERFFFYELDRLPGADRSPLGAQLARSTQLADGRLVNRYAGGRTPVSLQAEQGDWTQLIRAAETGQLPAQPYTQRQLLEAGAWLANCVFRRLALLESAVRIDLTEECRLGAAQLGQVVTQKLLERVAALRFRVDEPREVWLRPEKGI